MSLAEVSSPNFSTPSLERTPPQDVAAEQSVLGGMLLSKDAIADVVEVVRGAEPTGDGHLFGWHFIQGQETLGFFDAGVGDFLPDRAV